VLIVVLVIGLAMVAALTAAAGAVYDAVVEADGVAALDHPALDMEFYRIVAVPRASARA
jgi:hypothetical protein